ncbi:MAG: thiamine-phosphate pyrophosphorylase [Candidatus Omnitrophota bacterium]|nr:thiamine-phosphate pyrophosphorylase [Candidatus Omnitrophota bacterium]
MAENKLLQIIDANLNRTREGLRVCEDITRFAICDKQSTKSLKIIRHAATSLIINSDKVSLKKLLLNRDTESDKTKFLDFKTKPSIDISDVFMSNIERVKESLRVLEECFKIIDEKVSRGYRKLRFGAYDVEKRIVKKTGLISCNRQKRA